MTFARGPIRINDNPAKGYEASEKIAADIEQEQHVNVGSTCSGCLN
jgi:hypothetical protein